MADQRNGPELCVIWGNGGITMSRFLRSFARGTVIILVPIILVLAAVRLVLYPWYLEFEYRTPNFPPDSFGFTMDDRLHYARIALDYLLHDEDISFLAAESFP